MSYNVALDSCRLLVIFHGIDWLGVVDEVFVVVVVHEVLTMVEAMATWVGAEVMPCHIVPLRKDNCCYKCRCQCNLQVERGGRRW